MQPPVSSFSILRQIHFKENNTHTQLPLNSSFSSSFKEEYSIHNLIKHHHFK